MLLVFLCDSELTGREARLSDIHLAALEPAVMETSYPVEHESDDLITFGQKLGSPKLSC